MWGVLIFKRIWMWAGSAVEAKLKMTVFREHLRGDGSVQSARGFYDRNVCASAERGGDKK